MSKYDVVIGLEIHSELSTATKIFCRCRNGNATLPNENVCPVCLGMPGSLPVVSRSAIEKTIMAGLAFDCTINNLCVFERKNYFYPDLPKGYQTTQNDYPICLGGHIKLKSGKTIRLNRIHLEEDAGKLVHDEVRGETLIDYNRGGTPLIEMVTEPDINSADEAVEFLEEVRSRILFSGVSHARMEEGELRFDVNISLKPKGSKKFGNRVEMKNLNSFKMVARAIEFEIKRQSALLDNGQPVIVETRKWNDTREISTSMRTKEDLADYRYFPDPDQYPIKITRENVAELRAKMPKLAHELRAELETLGLTEYESDILTREKSVALFFSDALALLGKKSANELANWVLNDVLSRATNYEILLTPTQLVETITLVNSNKVTRKNAPLLLDSLWGKPAQTADSVAKTLNILGGVDETTLKDLINRLVLTHPDSVSQYAQIPDKVLTFFMGQIMKQTSGKADATLARSLLQAHLEM